MDDTDPGDSKSASDLTRYLAAAAYLDEAFRDDVLAQTLERRHRFIGPAYGVNVPCVVRHCLASLRLSRIRDVILSVLLFFALRGLGIPLMYYLPVLGVSALVLAGLASRKLKLFVKILLYAVAYIGFFALLTRPSVSAAVLALLVVCVDTYDRRYRIAVRQLFAKSVSVVPPPSGWHPRKNSFNDRRLAELDDQTEGNVVIYSGFSPFVGSGDEVKRWSFSINATQAPPSQADPPKAFGASDIHRHVVEALEDLHLEGLTVNDRLYVNGRFIRGDERFFQDPGDPLSGLQSNVDDISAFIAHPTETVRQYTHIQIVSWKSQLILSVFVRFWRTTDYLFVEWSYFVLFPLKGRYREVAKYNRRPTPHEFFRLVLDSARETPLVWLKAPLGVARWSIRSISRARREQRVRQAIRENLRFDYGATTSIRQMATSSWYGNYFQQLDVERYYRIIDRHLFDSISAFLQKKGVDTSELKLQMQLVVNGIVNNGTVFAGSMAGVVNQQVHNGASAGNGFFPAGASAGAPSTNSA